MGCRHREPANKDLPQRRWSNTLLGNLKSSLVGTFRAFKLAKYTRR
jgi:hypothetical protein